MAANMAAKDKKIVVNSLNSNKCRRGGILVVFGALGRWFEPTSRGSLAAKLDSCNSLLSSDHTLLVNILRCVRFYIKNKYYYYKYISRFTKRTSIIGSCHKNLPSQLCGASVMVVHSGSKSRELIIQRRSGFVPPPPIPDVSRVSSLSALGVVLRGDLDAHDHTSVALASCSRSLYALCTLRSRGLPSLALHEVTRATTLARLLFAAPAWWGFALALDRERLQRFLNKAIRMGYLSTNTPISVTWLLLRRMAFYPLSSSTFFKSFIHHSLPSCPVALACVNELIRLSYMYL